ncbi:hypothetical protein ESA_03013 [Cronobacter sakazakii ATCC BAA-894]|uniref:Uncharacterized protein n=1 Tax=Cronobacter sakazakii (strain ATCC BAA-894) TaxID=290339 RepID=A7MN43_CROS8|nr:hypothetical protein ESA_03013 [Cronobacter sakazakii ATCC BAA-894]
MLLLFLWHQTFFLLWHYDLYQEHYQNGQNGDEKQQVMPLLNQLIILFLI